MKRFLLFLALSGAAAADLPRISGERMRAHVKFLSSDLLEGRGVGTRGGRLAAEYLAAQFALLGAQPAGDDGTYFQKVPLVGVATQPDSELSAEAGGKTMTFAWEKDFVGADQRQRSAGEFDAEAVFVGHGIAAPEFQWDDYKGVDVKGKMLVLFTNEPDTGDAKLFGGRALTYYGRWTYKYEEALRRGAAGALIIHTDKTAGYGWNVVRNSWGREQSFVKLKPGEPALAFAGWLTRDAGMQLLALAGHTVEDLLKRSDARDFRPVPLGTRIRGRFTSAIREQDTRNVAAMVAGEDRNEAVVFSAHWDHLGIGTEVNGDAIYNGAVDNATGCAILLELARAWSLGPKRRRSAVFVAVTAEEQGLLGAQYYAQNPAIPAARTALALNFDGFRPFGRTRDVVLTGAERTTFWPEVQKVARRLQLEIRPEAHPEQGHFYRSDHFAFAKAGIPAFSINMGTQYIGKPAGFAEQVFTEFNTKHYHQPSDEYHDDWDFSGLEQVAELGLELGIQAATAEKLPEWRPGDEFSRKR